MVLLLDQLLPKEEDETVEVVDQIGYVNMHIYAETLYKYCSLWPRYIKHWIFVLGYFFYLIDASCVRFYRDDIGSHFGDDFNLNNSFKKSYIFRFDDKSVSRLYIIICVVLPSANLNRQFIFLFAFKSKVLAYDRDP